MTTLDDKKIEKKPNKKKVKKENIFPDGYDENLEGDEKDKKYLEGLTMLDREKIIDDRRQKREEMKNKMSIEQDYQKQLNSNKSKSGESKIAKNEQLADIRNKRNQKKERLLENQRNDKRQRGSTSSSESDYDSERDDLRSVDNRRNSDNDYDSDVKDSKVKKIKPNEKEARGSKQAPKEKEFGQKEIEPIILSRKKLVNMVSHRYFDDTVKGCFVRIVNPHKDGKNKSHDYMLALIKDVVVKKKYKLENKETAKHLVVTHADKSFTQEINYVSNSIIQEKEFDTWKTEMENAHLNMPNKFEINRKKDDITKALNYKYEDAEIKKMVDGNISSIIENPETTIDECNIAINYLEQEKSNLEDEKSDIWRDFNPDSKDKYSREKALKEKQSRGSKTKRPLDQIDHDIRIVESKLKKVIQKKEDIKHKKKTEAAKKNTSRILEELAYKNIYGILQNKSERTSEYINDKHTNEFKNSRFKDTLESRFHLCESAEAYEKTIKDFVETQNFKFSFEQEIDILPEDDKEFIESIK